MLAQDCRLVHSGDQDRGRRTVARADPTEAIWSG